MWIKSTLFDQILWRKAKDHHLPERKTVHEYANSENGTTFNFKVGIASLILGILGSYGKLPGQSDDFSIEISKRLDKWEHIFSAQPSKPPPVEKISPLPQLKSDSRDGAGGSNSETNPGRGGNSSHQMDHPPLSNTSPQPIPVPKEEHSRKDIVPPPVEILSPRDQLLAVLNQWRLHGVDANADDSQLLRDVDDSDAALFVSADRRWSEIKVARNVLKAAEIGLNAKTLAILPVFVEILIEDENSRIKQSVERRLSDAHFSLAHDRAHAAVVLSLANNHPPIRWPWCPPKDSWNGETHHCAEADVKLSAVYNYDRSLVVDIPSTQAESELNGEHQPFESESCAQLDAALNATDSFIKKYVSSPLPPQSRQGCN